MGVGPPAVVESLDVAHGRTPGFLAGGEAVVVVKLVLDGREGRLGHGIVPALTG